MKTVTYCSLSNHRDQAEEGEEAEREGPGGEEHPAALQDLRQLVVQGGTQEGHFQRTLQVPVHRQGTQR